MNKYNTTISHHHLDFMGHVNNAVYLQLMEEARWYLYNYYGYTKQMATIDKQGPIILEAHIKYRKEIILNEVVTIETICLEYDRPLGKMLQTVYKENGQKSCQAELVFGMFDLKKRKLLRPKGFWKDIHMKIIKHKLETPRLEV